MDSFSSPFLFSLAGNERMGSDDDSCWWRYKRMEPAIEEQQEVGVQMENYPTLNLPIYFNVL